ncbi:MAG: TetR/AcrR family transcriptional regulator [Tepidisphaeraceae bacterium]|jgi:AcrR family transcriptional regulator
MPRLKAAQRRDQLMAVATKLFAKWGYNATTTAAIAEAAGVTEPILYRHFSSKQELFVAITRAMSQHTLDYWQEQTEGIHGPAEKLRAIAKGFPDHIRKLEDAYHVLHGALATSRERKVLAVIREHYVEIEKFFAGIIIQGQSTGEFHKEMDPRLPAWQLINIGIGYAMIALNLPSLEHFSVEEGIEHILRGLKA